MNKKIKLRSQLFSSAIRSKDLTNNIFQKISIKNTINFFEAKKIKEKEPIS